MRWKIYTTTDSVEVSKEKIDSTQIAKTTSTTKTKHKELWISIGDIAASGKTAAAAIKNTYVNLAGIIKNFKNSGNTASLATATLANNMLKPLYTLVKGNEVYQKAMKVVYTVSPILKLVARATGVWCSPGNVMDIGQITLGMIQTILIGLLSSIITAIKDYIWNIEFMLYDITEDASTKITEILTILQEDIRKTVKKAKSDKKCYGSDGLGDPDDKNNPNQTAAIAAKTAKDGINSKAKASTTIYNPKEAAKIISKFLNKDDPELSKMGKAWETEYHISEKIVRLLRGSLNDGGIYYSDDGGKTWTPSEKTTDSFCCFAKININDPSEEPEYIYLAGSTHYVKNEDLSMPTDEDWSKDENHNQYDKDYYYIKDGEVNNWKKSDKDKTDFNFAVFNSSNGCYVANTKTGAAAGIWMSRDNGVTWTQTGVEVVGNQYIGNMFEFQPKVNPDNTLETILSRVVACSYDYQGIWYADYNSETDDLIWARSKNVVDSSDINYGRWVQITDGGANIVRATPYDITVKPVINNSVSTLNHCSLKGILSTACVKIAIPFNRLLEHLSEIIDTIKYIHTNYNVSLITYYTHLLWKKVIDGIIEGTYSLSKAQVGKGPDDEELPGRKI